VNIDHIDEKFEMPKDWTEFFNGIFKRQTELMHKYEEIEKNNGAIVPKAPWHIDDKFVQWRIKDFIWRFLEEITEAAEIRDSVLTINDTLLNTWLDVWKTDSNVRHFFEELADSLHFLVEMTMICGIRTNTLGDMCSNSFQSITVLRGLSTYTNSTFSIKVAEILFEIGLAANLLKNKKWKTCMMPTDIHKFRNHVIITWRKFIELWLDLGCERDFIYTIYMKKSSINQWRIKTSY